MGASYATASAPSMLILNLKLILDRGHTRCSPSGATRIVSFTSNSPKSSFSAIAPLGYWWYPRSAGGPVGISGYPDSFEDFRPRIVPSGVLRTRWGLTMDIAMIGDPRAASLTVALAVGLLIGIDRERHKNADSLENAPGVRTFALVALLGAIAALLESDVMVAVIGSGIVVLNALFSRGGGLKHPSQTTAYALLATFAIGFMTVKHIEMAAALGVLIALLLSSKSRLHRFALAQLTERELRDATLLAGAALIVLPLLPDHAIDPLGVINLRIIWRLTILMLLINALGYIARRAAGSRVGFAIAGFLGGFVSSILTITAMGRHAKADPTKLNAAVAGASFSSIATAIELLVILSITNLEVLRHLTLGISAMGIFSAIYGLAFTFAPKTPTNLAEGTSGRAFEPKLAVLFAGVFALMLSIAALVQKSVGPSAAQTVIALSGFIDTHAASASAARLASSGVLAIGPAVFAALLAITANTLVKALSAAIAGGRFFAVRVCPGHVGMLAALWVGWYIGR